MVEKSKGQVGFSTSLAVMQMLLVPPVLLFIGMLVGLALDSVRWSYPVHTVLDYATFGFAGFALAFCLGRLSEDWTRSAGLAWILPVLILLCAAVSEVVSERSLRHMKWLFIETDREGEAVIALYFFTLPAAASCVYSIVARVMRSRRFSKV